MEEDGVVLVDPSILRDRALIRCAFIAGVAASAVPSLTEYLTFSLLLYSSRAGDFWTNENSFGHRRSFWL